MTWKKGVFAKSKSDMRGVGTTVCMKKMVSVLLNMVRQLGL